METRFTCFTSTTVQILTLLYKQPLPCSPVLCRAAEARGSDACGNGVEAAGLRLFLRDHLPHNETQVKKKKSVEAAGLRLFLRDFLLHNETQVAETSYFITKLSSSEKTGSGFGNSLQAARYILINLK